MKVYTTGQAAKLCSVAPRTVVVWCESEGLRFYRMPGSEHRRIPRPWLVTFLEDNGMPTLEEMAADEHEEDAVDG